MNSQTLVSLPKKANLGCGPLPLYPQDLKYMSGNISEWLLIDKYIEGPGITNWDIEDLSQIPDDYLEEIYCSHALEHISHRKVLDILKLWYQKLTTGGKITINVPDLMYAFKQLKSLENDQVPEGLYNTFYGLHGVMTIIFGTHSQPGEAHLGGFTQNSLLELLEKAGFNNCAVTQTEDNHQMGVLIAMATK